jgi:hypothetical protein
MWGKNVGENVGKMGKMWGKWGKCGGKMWGKNVSRRVKPRAFL